MAVVSLYVAGLITLLMLWLFLRSRSKLSHIPGPRSYPIIGSLLSVSRPKIHESFMALSKTYGPVMRFAVLHGDRVVVSDYDSIRQVLITSGKACIGRLTGYRIDLIMKRTGIAFSPSSDSTWKSLRKASHKHLKQYGEGMERLEHVIQNVAEDMFVAFKEAKSLTIDPKQVIFDTALKSIAVLITGVRPTSGDPLIDMMRYFESSLIKCASSISSPKYMIYDAMPWLRHLRLTSWKNIQSVIETQNDIWQLVKKIYKENPTAESLTKVLLSYTPEFHNQNTEQESDIKHVKFTDVDVHKTILALLVAGVATTSATFYAAVNILAHRPDLQTQIFQDIENVSASGNPIGITDRPNMPFVQAFILEVLRYVTTAPLGVPHVAENDFNIGRFRIPKGTSVITNLWALHHDPDFWENPGEFCPDRFLDSEGDVIPADHPNRKHLLPFGAGPRVCLGESLALARLFLWVTMLVQRFEVVPAEGNNPSDIDSKQFIFETFVRVIPYKVKFIERD